MADEASREVAPPEFPNFFDGLEATRAALRSALEQYPDAQDFSINATREMLVQALDLLGHWASDHIVETPSENTAKMSP